MEQLSYHYAKDTKDNIISNRLYHVNDDVTNTGGTDIKDQGIYNQANRSTHNYAYDEIGNLISDKSEEIAEIVWNVSGKVSEVHRTSVSTKPDLKFAYDAIGNRISKTVINKQETENDKYVTTYYVRDPQGNVLAVYEHKRGETGDGTLTLAEQHLYGASRLGMTKPNLVLSGTGTNSADPTAPSAHYELTNHLGNVLAVITPDASDATQPAIESLTDYYPFGMEEPGRSYNSNTSRFGYTGHEKENDLAEGVYTTQYRLLDTRLGRWMSVDPLFGKYPDMSAYNYCGGNPMVMVDPDGRRRMVQISDGTETASEDDRSGQKAESGVYEYNIDKDGNGQFYRQYHYGNVAETPLPKDKWTEEMKMFDQGFTGVRSTKTGKALFDYFSGDEHDAFFVRSSDRTGIDMSNSHHIYYTGESDRLPTTSGSDELYSPAWVSLAHEMAHRQDYYLRGDDECNVSWYTMSVRTPNGVEFKKIPDTEKYATHVENIIRKEAGLPLRTHYDINFGVSQILKTSILETYTSESIFYLNKKYGRYTGNPDEPIGINVDPFDYNKDVDFIRK